MRRKKTLILALAALLILAGAYYWSTVFTGDEPQAALLPPAIALGNLEAHELVRIETNSFSLELDEQGWQLVHLQGGIPAAGITLDQFQIFYMAISLASLLAEDIVDDAPQDISVYGLDAPLFRTTLRDSSGRQTVYVLGDMTPSRNSYYAMELGDPKVYSVSISAAELIRFNLNNIRHRSLFGHFEPAALNRLLLERAGTRIEIVPWAETAQPALTAALSSHVLISPYRHPRRADIEALETLFAPINGLAIADFIDDAPRSLAPYGLDRPVRLFVELEDDSLELLIGNAHNGGHYAKLADKPNVFSLRGMGSIVNARPLNLIDRFALLVNIDLVENLTVRGGERPIEAELRGTGNDAVFYLNGIRAESASFRQFYQSLIGLLIDAEYSGPQVQGNGSGSGVSAGEISIEYRLRGRGGERVSIGLVPYNRDFYILRQGGAAEFLISANQVRRIFEAADRVVLD
ncbi:MAG: DUF4340 domain-containing protein [Treponema sp.]|nr:DUF4340 domain-containing protein [Treponema sp.]